LQQAYRCVIENAFILSPGEDRSEAVGREKVISISVILFEGILSKPCIGYPLRKPLPLPLSEGEGSNNDIKTEDAYSNTILPE
jgi:hypothetical protein